LGPVPPPVPPRALSGGANQGAEMEVQMGRYVAVQRPVSTGHRVGENGRCGGVQHAVAVALPGPVEGPIPGRGQTCAGPRAGARRRYQARPEVAGNTSRVRRRRRVAAGQQIPHERPPDRRPSKPSGAEASAVESPSPAAREGTPHADAGSRESRAAHPASPHTQTHVVVRLWIRRWPEACLRGIPVGEPG